MNDKLIIIESRSNPLIKHLARLHTHKRRTESGQFLVEGRRLVQEAVQAGADILSLIFNKTFYDRFPQLTHHLAARRILIPDALFGEVCETQTPQGIVAVVSIPEIPLGDGELIVLADKVQDPGNMGTILRTAHAAGAAGVIVTHGTVDVYSGKVLRSSMGSLFSMPVVHDDADGSVVRRLREEKGYRLVVGSLAATQLYTEVSLRGRVILAVGNEGGGIDSQLEAEADERVLIPMPGGAESLNVAVSAALLIYEKLRQGN